MFFLSQSLSRPSSFVVVVSIILAQRRHGPTLDDVFCVIWHQTIGEQAHHFKSNLGRTMARHAEKVHIGLELLPGLGKCSGRKWYVFDSKFQWLEVPFPRYKWLQRCSCVYYYYNAVHWMTQVFYFDKEIMKYALLFTVLAGLVMIRLSR